MRSCFGTALVFTLVAALAPAAQASDERHGPKVGSPAPAEKQALADVQGSTPPAAQPKPDPLSNGIGIGAAIGAGVGFGLVGWAYAECDDTCDAPEPLGMYSFGAGVGAAIGAVVGLIVDASRKNTNQRVSVGGMVTPKRSQLRVTVRW